MQSNNLKNNTRKFLVILGLWAIVTMLIVSVTIFSEIQAGMSVNVFGIIAYEFVCISPWILSTPAVMWLARTYRFDKESYLKSTGVHLTAALFVFCFHSIVQSNAVFYYYDEISFSWAYIQRDFLGFLDVRVILYLGILFAVYTLDFQKKNRAIRLRKSKLKAELSKAKFHALLNQIQPDFLISSIDAIKEKLNQNLKEAEEVLIDFSDLLRIMLNHVDREEIIIQQDLKSYHLYVNILSKRLDRNIEKRVEVDKDCYQAMIPSFLLLIPFFERIIQLQNFRPDQLTSIKYIAKRDDKDINLEIWVKGGGLAVEDISDLFQKDFSDITENLRSRYGQEIEFRIKNLQNHITSIGLTMPYINGGQFIEREKLLSSLGAN